MTELSLYKNIMLLGKGIDCCIENKLSGSALILIYSGIDTAGWLDSSEDYATKNSFINWVDAYLLRAKSLQCSSMDLYSARCGLLHTFTPESQLIAKEKARRIYYAWGNANVEDLQHAIDLLNKNRECVAVHINDLYEGWRLGVLQFAKEIEKDSERKKRAYMKARKFFSELGIEHASKVLKKNRK